MRDGRLVELGVPPTSSSRVTGFYARALGLVGGETRGSPEPGRVTQRRQLTPRLPVLGRSGLGGSRIGLAPAVPGDQLRRVEVLRTLTGGSSRRGRSTRTGASVAVGRIWCAPSLPRGKQTTSRPPSAPASALRACGRVRLAAHDERPHSSFAKVRVVRPHLVGRGTTSHMLAPIRPAPPNVPADERLPCIRQPLAVARLVPCHRRRGRRSS
jgi:hypothetical protein